VPVALMALLGQMGPAALMAPDRMRDLADR